MNIKSLRFEKIILKIEVRKAVRKLNIFQYRQSLMWKNFHISVKSHSTPQFTSLDYNDYGINGVNTSPAAPNMNAYVERAIGSIRREALDHFLLYSEKQIKKIIREYIDYYNHNRPHQGIDRIPDGESCNNTGKIRKMKILGGLHHHYYRSSA